MPSLCGGGNGPGAPRPFPSWAGFPSASGHQDGKQKRHCKVLLLQLSLVPSGHTAPGMSSGSLSPGCPLLYLPLSGAFTHRDHTLPLLLKTTGRGSAVRQSEPSATLRAGHQTLPARLHHCSLRSPLLALWCPPLSITGHLPPPRSLCHAPPRSSLLGPLLSWASRRNRVLRMSGSSLPAVSWCSTQTSPVHPQLNRFKTDLLAGSLKPLLSLLFLLGNGPSPAVLPQPETWESV